MSREKLPDRRPSVTKKIIVTLDGGNDVHVLVTVGFADRDMRVPREVFCADFKAGTAMHAIVTDACVLMSRLLQHGDRPDIVAQTLCQPRSLIGCIAQAVADTVTEELAR